MVERGRPHTTIWRMRIACYVPNAINTCPKYVILLYYCNNGWTKAPGCYFYKYIALSCLLNLTQNTLYCSTPDMERPVWKLMPIICGSLAIVIRILARLRVEQSRSPCSIPGLGKGLSPSLKHPTSSGYHLTSHSTRTGDFLSGLKRTDREAITRCSP